MLRVDSENASFKVEIPKENATIECTIRFLQSITQVGKPPSIWLG
jgi:hypothetical protein